MVRTRGGGVPIHELQSTVASVAPAVPIYRLSTMQQKISSTLERSHFDTFLLAIFATTALLLSSVGIYGVLSYMVAQRTRDIGIRMASAHRKRRLFGTFSALECALPVSDWLSASPPRWPPRACSRRCSMVCAPPTESRLLLFLSFC
jgi:hypothetical protein